MYRGDELRFSALVDPDNRRAVDWRVRDVALKDVAGLSDLSGCLVTWRNEMDVSRLKMLIGIRLLEFRRINAQMMASYNYQRITVIGRQADSVFAFRRCSGERELVVVVPRLTRGLGDTPVGEVWGDTHLVLPEWSARAWHGLIHEEEHAATSGTLRLADVFSVLQVAALVGNRS